MSDRASRLQVFVGQLLTAQRNLGADRGVTAIEYGLIASMIAMAIIAAVVALGGKVTTMFDAIAGAF